MVEYLSFLHLVNGNKAPTLRSTLSHLSWAHTSNGRDDPLKKHHATYVEAWMRALERREPRNAAGKRPATPDLLMMLFMNVSLQTYSAPVYLSTSNHVRKNLGYENEDRAQAGNVQSE